MNSKEIATLVVAASIVSLSTTATVKGQSAFSARHYSPLMTWPQITFPVLYYLDNTVPKHLIDGITDGFDTFNDAIEYVLYQRTYSENDSKILVTFANIDGKGDTLAMARWNSTESNTYKIANASIKFDSSEPWINSTETHNRSAYDIQSVATHEVGHISGLDHAEDRQQTMYYKVNPGSTKRTTLEPGDILAFRMAYNGLIP